MIADDADCWAPTCQLSAKHAVLVLETSIDRIIAACESHGVFSVPFAPTADTDKYGYQAAGPTLVIHAVKTTVPVSIRPYGAEAAPFLAGHVPPKYMPRVERWLRQFGEHMRVLFHKFTALNGLHLHMAQVGHHTHGPQGPAKVQDTVAKKTVTKATPPPEPKPVLAAPSAGKWARVKKAVSTGEVADKPTLVQSINAVKDSRTQTMDAAEYVSLLNAVGLLPAVAGKLAAGNDVANIPGHTVLRFDKKLGVLSKTEAFDLFARFSSKDKDLDLVGFQLVVEEMAAILSSKLDACRRRLSKKSGRPDSQAAARPKAKSLPPLPLGIITSSSTAGGSSLAQQPCSARPMARPATSPVAACEGKLRPLTSAKTLLSNSLPDPVSHHTDVFRRARRADPLSSRRSTCAGLIFERLREEYHSDPRLPNCNTIVCDDTNVGSGWCKCGTIGCRKRKL